MLNRHLDQLADALCALGDLLHLREAMELWRVVRVYGSGMDKLVNKITLCVQQLVQSNDHD